MPPKTRSKIIKVLQENVEVTGKAKLKTLYNGKKAPRKVLADKTNSTSDDNATLPPKKSSTSKTVNNIEPQAINIEKPKQRRVRRVPARFIGNPVLTNLSNSSNELSLTQDSTTPKIPGVKKKVPEVKVPCESLSPHKTKSLDNSIVKSRPKRICRLPSKLENHSISPNKYIPLQPMHASTPIANKQVKVVESKVSKDDNKISPLITAKKMKPSQTLKNNKRKAKPVSDTNNNGNGKQQPRIDKCFQKLVYKTQSDKTKSRKIVSGNSSYGVFDDIKKSLKRDSSKLDPYEFTFDPEEEPPPQKKKKKRVVKKSQPKPKTVVRGIYEKNLAKAMASLKNTVISSQTGKEKDSPVITEVSKVDQHIALTELNANKSIPCENNYNSVRVEDIALDLQALDEGHNIDYSPVNSPHRDIPQVVNEQSYHDIPVNDKDPLNLQEDLSFFDDQPIASSSMNMSTRHPLASPWRVEFNNLPIKWQANTYVKPNMTPAVESSFINSSDMQKKHIYTNIVPDTNESLPQIVDQPILKQTSIISFIREVAERNANKKKKSTPVKANLLYEGTHALNITPTKSVSSKENSKSDQSHISRDPDILSSDIHNEQENCDQSIFKTPNKNEETPNKHHTFFGFDEIEEQNQENISPLKKDKRVKSLRPRSRAVLQEINNMKGPSRAVIPGTVKSVLNSDNLNKNYEDPKSGMEPPVFVDKDAIRINVVSDLNSGNALENDDSQSVHLFEDIDLIHHYHPPRKSYGKAKKVAFRQNSLSDGEVTLQGNGEHGSSSEEDNLDDLSFKLPTVKPKRTVKKKMTKKQKISKKEEKEVETWAAGFNSMCEDIEGFDLVVE